MRTKLPRTTMTEQQTLSPSEALAYALFDLVDLLALTSKDDETIEKLAEWRNDHKYTLSRIARSVSRETASERQEELPWPEDSDEA